MNIRRLAARPAAPGHRAPSGEQPRLEGTAAAAGPGRRPAARRPGRSAARAYRGRQDRGRDLPAAYRHGIAALGSGPSVIYVAPLKALLNNLLPRLEQYAAGSAAGRRSGTATSQRPPAQRDPPRSARPAADHPGVAGSDADQRQGRPAAAVRCGAGRRRGRGARIRLRRSRLASARRPGADLPPGRHGRSSGSACLPPSGTRTSCWTGCKAQAAAAGQPPSFPDRRRRPGSRRNAERPALLRPVAAADVELDYVGSVGNAAHVIASLHHGEKRLVFCDSRQLVEELGAALRDAGVTRSCRTHPCRPTNGTAPSRRSRRPGTASSSRHRRWSSASMSATWTG